MWKYLVEKNIRASQVSNVGYGNEHRPIVVNDRHKLEEKYQREYKDMVKRQWLQLDVVCWFQGYSQLFLRSSILCLAVRKSLMVGGFYLGRTVSFLVNIPDLLRNLLKTAISCFVLRISGIYIKLEILQRIWQFLYWRYV